MRILYSGRLIQINECPIKTAKNGSVFI